MVLLVYTIYQYDHKLIPIDYGIITIVDYPHCEVCTLYNVHYIVYTVLCTQCNMCVYSAYGVSIVSTPLYPLASIRYWVARDEMESVQIIN